MVFISQTDKWKSLRIYEFVSIHVKKYLSTLSLTRSLLELRIILLLKIYFSLPWLFMCISETEDWKL